MIEIAEHPRKMLFSVISLQFIIMVPLLLAVVGEIFDMWANGRWFVDVPPELFLISCIVPLSGLFALKFTRIEVAKIQAKLEIYCRRNEFDKAHRLIERKILPTPKAFQQIFRGMKLWLLIKEEKYDEGLPLARKLTNDFPLYPFGWYLLAYMENVKAEKEAAKKSLEKALSLLENSEKTYLLNSNKRVLEYLLQDVKTDQYLRDLIKNEEQKT